ncbi:MAG: flagellar biosynthesis protein FlhF [Deltaproteobacteria bacterium]|nr:flagellar biosynthesis protein FlhF [Deltaproteobacteria bacterium]
MQVKRFEATNIREALVMIKKDLGPDAVVLSTKKIKGPKNFLVEVIAARDVQDVVAPFGAVRFDERDEVLSNHRDQLALFKAEMDELKTLIADTRGVISLRGELAELKETINAFFDVLGMGRSKEQTTGHLARIYYHLIGNGVSKARVCRLMGDIAQDFPAEEVGDYEKGIKIVEEMIAKSFPAPAERTQKRVKVFVGPTGVGKTTTLAKLAAQYAVTKKMNIGLITTDTYRIAAVEQLKTYARIIGIPFEVASEREIFKKSLDHFAGKDIILIDTPGRSSSDGNYLKKLKEMLTADVPIETNLLLSLTSSQENSMDAAVRFGIFDYDHVIFTKLDECTRPGLIYDLASQIGKPVSHVTNGQNVPRDIEKVSPVQLTKLVMGKSLH